MAFVYSEIGTEMNFLARFAAKFRPNMKVHEELRASAEDTMKVAESVKDKRETFAREVTDREFPVATLIERRRDTNNDG